MPDWMVQGYLGDVLSYSRWLVHRARSAKWGTGHFFTQASRTYDHKAKKPSRRFISSFLRHFKEPLEEEISCVGIGSASGLQMHKGITHVTTVCPPLIKRRCFSSFTERFFFPTCQPNPFQLHEPRNCSKCRSGERIIVTMEGRGQQPCLWWGELSKAEGLVPTPALTSSASTEGVAWANADSIRPLVRVRVCERWAEELWAGRALQWWEEECGREKGKSSLV